jgi:cation transport protein ChaC
LQFLEARGPDPGTAGDFETGAAPRTPELEACLCSRTDLWVFGYGSLMWNPGFRHEESRPALLFGWHRRFCVYSHRYRGTPEKPGLVLGLDKGGSCRGVAFRVRVADIPEAMEYLWDREMRGGAYEMREVGLRLPSGPAKGRAFVVRRHHKSYAGRLSIEDTARLILQGIGARGHCREYLRNTVQHLEELGLVDGPLHRLELAVKEIARRELPCADAVG